MCCTSAESQRLIYEECMRYGFALGALRMSAYDFFCRWVHQRKAFNRPLTSQAVVRNKLAGMIARVESVQNWLENITYQMNNMV